MSLRFVSPIDLGQNELQNAVVQNLAADPNTSGLKAGQVWYNSATNQLKQWNGTAMVVLATLSNRLDQFAAPTAAVSFNSQAITNLAAPTNAGDAATKSYVDALVQGLDPKQSVRAASTANLALSAIYSGQTIDGVTLATGDRVLLKNQTDATQNGIIIVPASSGTPARSADMNTSATYVEGSYTFVEGGTVNAQRGFIVTTKGTITPGTTAVTWAPFLSTAAGLQKVAATIGDGATTSIAITHNLGTRDVQVQAYYVATPYQQIVVEVQYTDLNNVTLVFSAAPAANSVRVVIIG